VAALFLARNSVFTRYFSLLFIDISAFCLQIFHPSVYRYFSLLYQEYSQQGQKADYKNLLLDTTST
jgi:hypothetical protein